MSETATWIAADWGTTHVRAWAMSSDDRVLAEADAPTGAGALKPGQFEQALLKLAGPWLSAGETTDVFVCGMAGAREGWMDAGYEAIPFSLNGGRPSVSPDVQDARINVRILHGLMQSDPVDVMRGEETQIAGLLERDPEFSGAVCLPGTHTKWASVRNGAIERFKTLMTGETFAILTNHTMLKHVCGRDGWDDDAFLKATFASMDDPAQLLGNLFSVRASQLVSSPDPAAARSMVSGYLLGSELAATVEFWSGERTLIIGNPQFSQLYARALGERNAEAVILPPGDMTLGGLIAARRSPV